MTMSRWLIVLIIGVPWLGAVVLRLVDDRRARLQHFLAAAFACITGAVSVALLFSSSGEAALSLPLGEVFGTFTFVPDAFGVSLSAIAAVIGCLAVIFSVDYMQGEAQLGRYYSFILLFIGAMAGLVLSGNLLLLFFFWEITALCSYVLISFYNDDPNAVKGGLQALIVTQLGGVGLLAGALIIQANLGTYQISTFLAEAHTLPAGVLSLAAFGCLFAAAAKSAQAPFHYWLPGAMEAPTPVTALIHAATMVNAGVYLLARFYPAFEAVPGWKTAVVTVGSVTALIAGIMAITAVDLKRVLAYSTVSQLGYMVYAIGVGGVFASQFHLFSHAIFKALLFLAAGTVIHSVGTRDMRQMSGLGRSMPYARAVFIVGSLALTGIPIFNGFWSKELVLESGAAVGPSWAYIIMLLGAGLTAIYTIRMVWMVFYKPAASEEHYHDAAPYMRVSLGVLAAGVVVGWLLVGPLGRMMERTLPYHHLHGLTLPELFAEAFRGAPLTLAIVFAGFVLYLALRRFAALWDRFDWLARFADMDFGFSWISDRFAGAVQGIAEGARVTQTGQLNWNIFGLVLGLIVILAVLIVGAA